MNIENNKENNICNGISFADCELAILRQAVEQNERKLGEEQVKNESVMKMIYILEDFLRRKRLICYGGIAINNILPKKKQFYDRRYEIPDYDFYSSNALDDAKELADIYVREGFDNVEAKAGVHYGTFKVFVQYVGIADITECHEVIYSSLQKNAIIKDGIYYCPPNFLRMAMYLELSRPNGDVSRWEKVLKRINLLNKYYPLSDGKNRKSTFHKCNSTDIQRKMNVTNQEQERIFFLVRNLFIQEKCVFFGGYANQLLSIYMPKHTRNLQHIPDFDVLSENCEDTATKVVTLLKNSGFNNSKKIYNAPIGELIPENYEIVIGTETVAFIYKPIACHSYNTITIDKNTTPITIYVATIDTMLCFYLAFLYIDKPPYNLYTERIMCMSHNLYLVEEHNRLSQTGLLKRFTITCYGKQPSLMEIRDEKGKMRQQFLKKGIRQGREFDMWFLNYRPDIASSSSSTSKINVINDTTTEFTTESAIDIINKNPKYISKKPIPNNNKNQTKKKRNIAFTLFSTFRNRNKNKKTRKDKINNTLPSHWKLF